MSVIRVRLDKRAETQYGLRVCKRSDIPPTLMVEALTKNGEAEESGLIRPGDIVLKVNLVDVSTLSFDDAVNTFQSSVTSEAQELHLLIRAPIGYTTHLETTFDMNGCPKTYRITERIYTPSTGHSSLGLPVHVSPNTSTTSTTAIPISTTTTPTTSSASTSSTSPNQGVQPDPVMSNRGRDPEDVPTPKAVTSSSSSIKVSPFPTPNVTINLTLDETGPAPNPDAIKRRQSLSPRTGDRCPARRPVKLKNVLSGQPSADTLHQSSIQTIGCNDKVCTGSLMNWKHQIGFNRPPRTVEDTIRLAQNFIDQYYSSIKRLNSPSHETRWKEVQEEITSSGSYELKETELIFGAKLAWRNASRCIGRIQWSKLQVFDFRSVSSTREMFEAICNHIKYATNKGNLRSAITIFPQRIEDSTRDFRVWNSQLISYAGYADENNPNLVTGDPMNVEFTQLCLKLGWKGTNGRWDILPLVLSANGQDPQMYDIPEELILRVKLTHSKHDWWQDMGLEWYALPAVSGMLLDVGGLEFPACPFSGWYMVTEIACRDLCDTSRYNILEDVAKRLSLDTRSNTTLWKDIALAEINLSVMESFTKAGVTLVDHHTASESFMKHLENEQRLRGGCPADWVWVVPPLSSSLTPVFHQEMVNYELTPSYEYQESPLKTHVWKSLPGSEENTLTPARKIRFKEIAKAVKFTSNLFGKALSKRIKATVLYATETGKSEQFAKRLENIFSHAFNVNVVCMTDYDTFNLEHEALLLIVTSTFGNGDPPENGESFARQLQAIKVTGDTTPDIEMIKNVSMSYIRISSVESLDSSHSLPHKGLDVAQVGPLSNIRFGVFALGSSAYPNFCAFGRFVDNMLAELGGERIAKLATGDELCGQEQAFTEWAQKVFREAGEVFCFGDEVNMSEVLQTASLKRTNWVPSDVKLEPTKSKVEVSKGLSTGFNRKVFELEMINTIELYDTAEEDARKTIRVTLEVCTKEAEFNYLPGDHLGIFPENPPQVIEAIGKRLPYLKMDCVYNILLKQIRRLGPKEIEDWIPNDRIPRTSIREALKRYIDIMATPTQQLLSLLSSFCEDIKDQEKLLLLSSNSSKYEEWRSYHIPSFLDLLILFPSLDPPAELILTQLPQLQPRFYSISSSPLFNTLNSLSKHPHHPHMGSHGSSPVSGKKVSTPYSSSPLKKGPAVKRLIEAKKFKSEDITPDPSIIDLTVAVVKYNSPSGKERVGICSNFLLQQGLHNRGHIVYGFIRSAPNFRLPDKEDVPIIMVGPGTGIAPFRAFWLHRYASLALQNQRHFGSLSLFFGCRTPTMQLYKEEIEEMMEMGVLENGFVAYSRHPNKPKRYVQDFLMEQSESVYDKLIHKKGHFFVCGDVSMAEDVCKTLKAILKENGLDDPDQALINLRESMRYHEDIFGITLRTAEVTRKGREALTKRSSSACS